MKFRISLSVYSQLRDLARADRRTIAEYIRIALEDHCAAAQANHGEGNGTNGGGE